jgi:membrane protein YdbS with pleckstrin-like domain
MSLIEKEELNQIPKEYRPLTVWSYVWHFIFFLIPLLGTVFWVCTAFFSKRIPLRSYARGLILLYVVFLILNVVFFGGSILLVWLSPTV